MKLAKRFSEVSLVALVATALCVGAHAQAIAYDKTEFIADKLGENVYTLTGSPGVDPGHPEGAGGRIGLLVGPEGVLMVDASYAPLTDKVVAAIRKLSPAPIRFLVDTHEHPDHTGGNPNFARLGAVIFAREEVRDDLSKGFPPAVAAFVGNAASGTDPDRLPTVAYGLDSSIKIRLDGETVDLIPVVASHTNGDTMVKFEKADVIMIGDFYRNYGYPFIDPAHGGTFKGVVAALDTLTNLAGPNTKLIPGHGTPIRKTDIVPYRQMILDVQSKVQQMIDSGKSLKEVLAAKVTAPYDDKVPGGVTPLPAGLGTSADRFVGAMYTELKGAH
jgi:glyoxylase-like metal-dependent hydrolase (beta-lactamase superfamily II)